VYDNELHFSALISHTPKSFPFIKFKKEANVLPPFIVQDTAEKRAIIKTTINSDTVFT
jgi:hypothetical protein